MKLLVITALFSVATAGRPGSGGQSGTPVYRSGTPVYQYGTPTRAQSQYSPSQTSSGYGLKSRRTPFQSTLEPLDRGYKRYDGDSDRNNGGYDSQSHRGYSPQTTERRQNVAFNRQPFRSYSQQRSGGSSQQRSGVYDRPESTPAPQPYSFSYDVLDVFGNDYGAAEQSNGRQVQGQYSVLLPDGRLQTVSYSVQDDSGFVADVRYEGEARFVDSEGREQGRSSVTRGDGPAKTYRYGDN